MMSDEHIATSSRSRIAGNTALEIGGKTKPLREAGVLHVEPWNEADVRKGKKILCHKCNEDVGNTDSILLSSLRTIRNANIDIPHHGQVVGWNFFPSFVFAGQGS